VKEFKKIAGQV